MMSGAGIMTASRAAQGPGDPGGKGLLPYRQRPGARQSIGLWTFMGVATALFSLFFAAYVMRLSAFDATAIVMPRQLVLSTAWLVLGSVLLQRAARLAGSGAEFRWPLLAGGACALAFIVVQWWAWQDLLGRQVSLQGNPAGSFFYLLTTMHGLHVAGGIAGWSVAVRAAMQRPVDVSDAGWRVALCARYWHFLLFVWLVMYAMFSFITPDVAALICGTR